MRDTARNATTTTTTHPTTPSRPRLEAASVSKRYGETLALTDASLAVHDGESVAIMGPSGSGKTTLLHVLAGVIRPDEGNVTVRSRDGVVELGDLDEAARSALRLTDFGFVFQEGMLIPELTAAENVSLPLMLSGVSRRDATEQAAVALARLGLRGLDKRRPGQLSGGQAQRVAIARATVTGAHTVFADEPTGALDSRTAMDVMDALLEAATTGVGHCLVVVTHDEHVAARCSRIVRMLDGRVSSVAASGRDVEGRL